MRKFERGLTLLCVGVLVAAAAARPAAQRPPGDDVVGRGTASNPTGTTGAVTGTVTDTSAGVLPGVVVSAIAADGRVIATLVTGGAGDFTFDRLPVGPVELRFELDGFEDTRVPVTIHAAQPGGRAPTTVTPQLRLAALAEHVVVEADAPPVRPVLQPVAAHDPAAVCGPTKPEGAVPFLGRVESAMLAARGLFGAGDQLAIDAGENVGLRSGDNFIVRRRFPTPLLDGRNKPVMGDHASGLVQIVSVQETTSTAVVVYVCDEVMAGDYLVTFEAAPLGAPRPGGAPSFELAARILFADLGQGVGTTNRLLVIDRGRRAGVEIGQRFTLFRRPRGSARAPLVVGEAVVVAAQQESATIRIVRATDAVFPGHDGDWAAPHHDRQARQ